MEKAEFRNDSPGVCGAVTINPGEKPHAVAVAPGDTIWLTEEEQILTANAPRKAEDNPFVNGTLALVTAPQEMANRRPIGHSEAPQTPLSDDDRQKAQEAQEKAEEAAKLTAEREAERQEYARKQAEEGARPVSRPENEETGLQVEPAGEPPEGERAVDEEVGTPKAAAKASTPTPKPVPAKSK